MLSSSLIMQSDAPKVSFRMNATRILECTKCHFHLYEDNARKEYGELIVACSRCRAKNILAPVLINKVALSNFLEVLICQLNKLNCVRHIDHHRFPAVRPPTRQPAYPGPQGSLLHSSCTRSESQIKPLSRTALKFFNRKVESTPVMMPVLSRPHIT